MDRDEFVTSVLAGQPEPGRLVYLERRGDEYAWRLADDGGGLGPAGGDEGDPRAWIWHADRWPLDAPWPFPH